jgi:dCMP deaminase
LHAEENAVINCMAPRGAEKVVFTTNLPCPMCSKRLINMGGVQRVFYHLDYRIKEGLELLEQAGIQYAHLFMTWDPE